MARHNAVAALRGKHPRAATAPPSVYPFTSIVGQEEMKLALLLNVIAPSIGGVLIMGHRGTGKSTAVRALADLLPPIVKVRGCRYNCDPLDQANMCVECMNRSTSTGRLARQRSRVPVVDLPLGATEDRICGTLSIERALRDGALVFEPGLLAHANRGFLYIDEVNLLEDHLVDLLLDAAMTGRNKVEREGISTEHPARFVLVGSGNPEEGELRPQLLDRFGLYTEIRTAEDVEQRVEIVERREAFEKEPARFLEEIEPEQARLRRRLSRAQRIVREVEVPRTLVRRIAQLCLRLKIDGHRGELTITRAARALAAFENRGEATDEDVRRVAAMALKHRLRRDPLEQTTGDAQIERAVEEFSGKRGSAGEEEGARKSPPRDHLETPVPAGSSEGPGAGAKKPEDGTRMGDQRPSAEGGGASRGPSRSAPPTEGHLPEVSFASRERKAKGNTQGSARQRRIKSPAIEARRGRYIRARAAKPVGARLAIDATLRAAAPAQLLRRQQGVPERALCLITDDLRFKRFTRRRGTLFILAIDSSGSMAMNRISQAKGALAELLRQSYIQRDRIALVSFRQRESELLLPPCSSAARAKRILDALEVGGATPLAAGLLRALEVARRATREGTDEAGRVVLLLFTDGRANVALHEGESEDRAARKWRIKSEIEQLGAALQRAKVSTVVIDTQERWTSNGEGQALAAALGGRYLYLPTLAAHPSASRRLIIT